MAKNYSFIGAGNMAGAIIKSFLLNGVSAPNAIAAFDIDKNKYNTLKETGIILCNDISEAISFADYVVLAVKPQFMLSTLEMIKAVLGFENKVYVSIAAGITTEFIEDALSIKLPIIRTMPNTPFLVGMGAIALSKNVRVSNMDFKTVHNDFSLVAATAVLQENQMNQIVSVNGSSPAYVFKFIRAMLDGAMAQGFSEDQVKELIFRSIEGSVEMVRSSGFSLQQLIDMVTSKKGTTEKAIETLDQNSFEESIKLAMNACTKRAIELAEGK